MTRTIFSTPVLTPIMRLIAMVLMRLFGWKVVNRPPAIDKYVMIAAPHTSNWDFIVMLGAALDAGMSIHWMGKHTLFPAPIRPLMIWLGGIPIDRRKSQNMVQQVVERYDNESALIVAVPPEGTRGKTDRWKTGFYHIAVGAKVPVVLSWLDFAKKEAGFGPAFIPTGDIEKELPEIRAFYLDKTPKNPDLFT
jgi:1-acyl-sn-glycerol-3-phosphate acyltransferase